VYLLECELLPKCEVLQRQLPVRANRGTQCPNKDPKPSDHDRPIEGQPVTARQSRLTSFCEGQALIFEAVRAALEKAVVKIVLITRRSLGSAWVFTESVGEGEDKPQLRVFDGSDAPLMTLLSTWQPPVRHGATHFRLTQSTSEGLSRGMGRWNARKP
jgi:hypothetical protein